MPSSVTLPATISNDLLSSTIRNLKDEALNQLQVATPLMRFAKDKGKIKLVDGSTYYEVPAILGQHTGLVQLNNGYEKIDTTAADVLNTSSYRFCEYYAGVSIAKTEERANRGKYAIVDIAKSRFEQTLQDMVQEWEKQILAGSSTILTNLATFNGVGSGGSGLTSSGTGWFEDRAFGSQNNTVGTLSKSTYAAKNWQQQLSDASSALSIDDMMNLQLTTGLYTPRGGIDLIIGSPKFWLSYRGLLSDVERYGPNDDLDGGRPTLLFGGARVYASSYLPVANGTNTLSAYFLNMSNIEIVFDKMGNFEISDFKDLDDYAVKRAKIFVSTLIAANHLASQGLLINAES